MAKSIKKYLAVTACAAGFSIYKVYDIIFRSPDKHQNDDFYIPDTEQMRVYNDEIKKMITKLNERPYERVSIESYDGYKLYGRLYIQDKKAPVIIGFHGYRGTPSRDLSGGAGFYLSRGYNLLLPEQRAHCGSEGGMITYGVKERYDCLAWAGYAAGRFGRSVPIIITGISMGASTVLMASALKLPGNVKGIIADSPYTTPGEIIKKVAHDKKYPSAAILAMASTVARLKGGFGLFEANAAEAVKKAKVPILLIHGDDDRFVPYEMGKRIAEAAPANIEFHTFEGAGHGLSYLVDRERYENIVSSFLDRVLPKE